MPRRKQILIFDDYFEYDFAKSEKKTSAVLSHMRIDRGLSLSY